jgi:xylulose-5-phosphate/fructose-6-phosphate phosphoketolase
MITPTIKKEVRNGIFSARRTARSTGKRASLGLKKEISKNGALSAYGAARSTVKGAPLTRSELDKIEAYWRASLYLSMGMIYLRENPLLQKPLKAEHIKARLLGHWGSDAGQSFTYIHFNRLINK